MNLTFSQALKAAVTAASTDYTLPLLCTVQVHPDRMLATDRYRAVRSKWDYNGPDFEPFVLDVATVKDLAKGKEELASVEHDEANNTVTLTFNSGTSRVVRTVEGNYPAIERLIDGFVQADTQSAPNMFAFNPDYLAAWKISTLARNTGEKKNVIEIHLPRDSNKAVKFVFADHFEAILMSVRLNAS